MNIANKQHDSSCKESDDVMDLSIGANRSPLVTLEIKSQGNRLYRHQDSRRVFNLEREKTSCNTGKYQLME